MIVRNTKLSQPNEGNTTHEKNCSKKYCKNTTLVATTVKKIKIVFCGQHLLLEQNNNHDWRIFPSDNSSALYASTLDFSSTKLLVSKDRNSILSHIQLKLIQVSENLELAN